MEVDLLSLTNNKMEVLKWNEAIRKRPGMYLGQVNHKGFADNLKKLISQMIKLSGSDTVRLLFKDETEGEIEFDNIQFEFSQDISIINQNDNQNSIDLPILNGLSKWMILTFDSNVKSNQQFEKGEIKNEPSNLPIKCSNLKICLLYTSPSPRD